MPNRFTYHAIAAMAENRVIGNAGAIPWHLPDDFKWFKKTTMGQTLLMGRKTFESIGRPLPGRQTLILSRSDYSAPKTITIQDSQSVESVAEHSHIWVAGGAEIYKLLLPICKDLYLTRVHSEPEGDTHFPEFESQFVLNQVLDQNEQFSIEHWLRS